MIKTGRTQSTSARWGGRVRGGCGPPRSGDKRGGGRGCPGGQAVRPRVMSPLGGGVKVYIEPGRGRSGPPVSTDSTGGAKCGGSRRSAYPRTGPRPGRPGSMVTGVNPLGGGGILTPPPGLTVLPPPY